MKLKEFRSNMGITQQYLSKKIGVSRSTIAMWESGSSQPDNDMLLTLADFFNTSIDCLLGKKEQEYQTTPPATPSKEELKVALFGGDQEVTDEMWDEVAEYAKFIKQKHSKS